MTLNNLISELTDLLADGIDGNTELILFSEELPGMARQLDYLDVDLNGNYVQLFMRYN